MVLSAPKKKNGMLLLAVISSVTVSSPSVMLDIPVIKMCSFSGTKWMDKWVGNPSPCANLAQISCDYSDRMNFWQRTLNTLSEIYMKLGRIFYVIPQHDAILWKYFNPRNIPSISVSEKSTSLLLINQHFSIGHPRPLMPNTVEIGGIHIIPPKSLAL
jgi:glucuronosyltransferase